MFDKFGMPSMDTARDLILRAEAVNPGPWIGHSTIAGECAMRIAKEVPGMDPEKAYVLGLLHDIGRIWKMGSLVHVYAGWKEMNALGYGAVARVCLTHSFQVQCLPCFIGKIDVTPEQARELEQELLSMQYDDYDRLIQLCDALAYPNQAVCIEKRLVDVARRHGFNDMTLDKWETIFSLKAFFDEACGRDIYEILGINA